MNFDIPYEQLRNRAMHLIRRGCSYTHFDVNNTESRKQHVLPGAVGVVPYDACITELGKLFQSLFAVGSSLVEGGESTEGSPFTRMHRRIHMKSINRLAEREYYIHAHQKVLAMVRSAAAIVPQKMTEQMWNMSDDERCVCVYLSLSLSLTHTHTHTHLPRSS